MDNRDILPRHLSAELEEALKSARVVNVIGPRQVGKTTLVRDLFHHGRFITLDDEAVLSAIDTDAAGQLASLAAGPLIIDEAQRSKNLALAIKKIVDENRRKGQFVLTGSSNIFTTLEVADSLAGRMRVLKLWPLTVSEAKRRPPTGMLDWALSAAPDLADLPEPEHCTRAEYIDLILQGGFPEIRSLALRQRQRQYRDYVDSIIDRDVADISPVRKPDALRRLIDQLAARTASELNIAELCELLGIRRETVTQYLDILLRLSMITKLGAWTSGESRREIKNAKYHFADTGIAAALRGLTPQQFEPDADPTALGGLLESFVYAEIMRAAPFLSNDFRFYHWRDNRGREIDVLAESATRLVAVEVKASANVTVEDFRHARWFASEGPGKNRSVTVIQFYLGQEKLRFGDRTFALPVSTLWSI